MVVHLLAKLKQDGYAQLLINLVSQYVEMESLSVLKNVMMEILIQVMDVHQPVKLRKDIIVLQLECFVLQNVEIISLFIQ